jgi:hypothetical protein
VNFSAVDAQGSVVIALGLRVGCVQEAVHGAVGVVVELNLPNPELVGSAHMGTRSDVVDRFLGQRQLRVKVHELRHVLLLQSVANGKPATLASGRVAGFGVWRVTWYRERAIAPGVYSL